MIPPEMRLKQLETAVGPCAWQPRGSHVHGPADIGNHRIDNENTLGVVLPPFFLLSKLIVDAWSCT